MRKRFLGDFFAYRGVFGYGPSNAANCIFPRPTPVAMATKFGTKWAITRLARGDFCAYRGVFGDGPSNAANCIFPRPTPVAMATKFGTKLAITRLA